MLKIGTELENIIKELIKNEKAIVYDMNDSNKNYGYTNGIAFPTTKNSEVIRTGLPDLSQYSGRSLKIFVKYGVNNFYVGQTLIPNVLRLQILSGYSNEMDLWLPILRLSNYNSTTWKLNYDNSFVINNNNTITQDAIARKFVITKIIVE